MTQPAKPLYITQDEYAALHHVSRNAVIAARGRGEISGVKTIGTRVLISLPRLQLESIGLSDPAALGSFMKALGVKSLDGLLRFLASEDGDGGGSECACTDQDRQRSRGQGRSEPAHT